MVLYIITYSLDCVIVNLLRNENDMVNYREWMKFWLYKDELTRMKVLQRKMEGNTWIGVKSTQHCPSLCVLYLFITTERYVFNIIVYASFVHFKYLNIEVVLQKEKT